MMKRTVKAVLMVAVAILVGVGTVYAAYYTADYYVATGDVTSWNTTATEMDRNDIQFTEGEDHIYMAGGSDYIYTASGNDTVNMGPGSDKLTFYAQSTDEEEIAFDSGETSYIKYTNSNANIEIRSGSGDVIIRLGD